MSSRNLYAFMAYIGRHGLVGTRLGSYICNIQSTSSKLCKVLQKKDLT